MLNLCVDIEADLQVIDDTKHSAPCFACRPVMIRLPDRDACLEVMVLMYHAKNQGFGCLLGVTREQVATAESCNTPGMG